MMERSPYSRWIGATVGRYRLEQELGQNELGPLFTARNLETNATCLVRVLAVPTAQTPEALALYAARMEQEAARVAALQHPYILPLIDYGLHAGLPYLVWPGLVMRSLSTRLAQSGPLDVVTVGRYVDQIAAALEAAHQQNILHRNLSADNVFIQLDGHLLVADIGVRRLVELIRGDDGGVPYYGSMEACAPEQLGDGRVGAYTDVYALGALTFRLLTGRPVFTADSPEALLEQHRYAQPVPLRAVRAGLPVALDGVAQTALAKDPTRRFAQPGAFADAYQQVVAPNSMMRVSFSATPGAETGRPRATPSDPARAPSRPRGSGVLRADAATALDARPDVSTASRPLAIDAQWIDDEMLAARKRRRRSKRAVWQIAVALALVIIVAANALFLSGAFSHNKTAIGVASGDVEFLDSSSATPGGTDAVRIVLRNVSAPAAGHAYYAWIINQATEQTTPLGRLTPSQQTYTLRYASPAAGSGAGANALTLGDKIEVTLEQGSVALPVGKVILSATFPPQAFVHIQHLLVSFPTTPGKIGLLVGVLDQTQEVEAQATLLQNAASAANNAAVQCGAQSILDIIEGAQGPHYHPLSAACQALNITLTGDGFGLLDITQADQSTNAGTGYLDGASDHASLAATTPDATPDIKLHAGHVEIAVANIKRWLLTADQDALKLVATPTNAAAIADLVAVSDHAYHGVSVNGDQSIDPVNGQAGAVTAYEHGQFMATLTLTAAATK